MAKLKDLCPKMEAPQQKHKFVTRFIEIELERPLKILQGLRVAQAAVTERWP